MGEVGYNDLDQFFARLSTSGLEHERERSTVFTVGGFPRRELVASRMLEFFLGSSEHGLEDLWFKSFVEALSLGHHDFGDLETVRTEEFASGLFLDLVVETDTTVIGIENKIDARVYNNLEVYLDHLKRLAESDFDRPPRQYYLVVLAPRNVVIDQDVFDTGNCFLLLYDSLFAKVQANLGSYLDGADLHWLGIMRDFIETVSRISRVDDMGVDRIEFIGRNIAEIRRLHEVLDEHRNWVSNELEVIFEKTKNILSEPEVRSKSFDTKLTVINSKITKGSSSFSYVRGYLYLDFDNAKWRSTVIGRYYAESGLKMPDRLTLEAWIDDVGLQVAMIDHGNTTQAGRKTMQKLLREQCNDLPGWFQPREPVFFGKEHYQHLHPVTSVRVGDSEGEKVNAIVNAVSVYRHLLRADTLSFEPRSFDTN